MIWFAIVFPGFRKFLIACAAGVALAVFIAIANHHYDNDNRQNATYRPMSHEVTNARPDITKLSDEELTRLYRQSLPGEIVSSDGTCLPEYESVAWTDRLHCRLMK